MSEIDYVLSVAAGGFLLGGLLIGSTKHLLGRQQTQRRDRARAHKERLEAYTEFLAAGMEMFAAKAVWRQNFGDRSAESLGEEEALTYFQRKSRRRFSEAVRRLRVLGEKHVVLAAQQMFITATTLDETAVRQTTVERIICAADLRLRAFEAAVRRELRSNELRVR